MFTKTFNSFGDGVESLMKVSHSAESSLMAADYNAPDNGWTPANVNGRLAQNVAWSFYQDQGCMLFSNGTITFYETTGGICFGWKHRRSLSGEAFEFFLINKHQNPNSTLRQSALKAEWEECSPDGWDSPFDGLPFPVGDPDYQEAK